MNEPASKPELLVPPPDKYCAYLNIVKLTYSYFNVDIRYRNAVSSTGSLEALQAPFRRLSLWRKRQTRKRQVSRLTFDRSLAAITDTHCRTTSSIACPSGVLLLQGTRLPDDVVPFIVCHAQEDQMRTLHMVGPAWRKAVCQRIHSLAPSHCDPAKLSCARFPEVTDQSPVLLCPAPCFVQTARPLCTCLECCWLLAVQLDTLHLNRLRFKQPLLADLPGLTSLVLTDCFFMHSITELTAITVTSCSETLNHL